MNIDDRALYSAILVITALKEASRTIPAYALSVELSWALKGKNRECIDQAADSLALSGLIKVGKTLNHKYYEIKRDYKYEKIMEHFQIAIKSFLEKKASSDPHFAERLKIESKSMEECCNYILGEVEKKATGQWAACTDEEVFDMAVHYWDEDNIKVKKPTQCKVVTNKKLTPEEKKEAEALRTQKGQKAKEQQEDAKARAEDAKAKRKKQEEEGSLFLFSDEDFI